MTSQVQAAGSTRGSTADLMTSNRNTHPRHCHPQGFNSQFMSLFTAYTIAPRLCNVKCIAELTPRCSMSLWISLCISLYTAMHCTDTHLSICHPPTRLTSTVCCMWLLLVSSCMSACLPLHHACLLAFGCDGHCGLAGVCGLAGIPSDETRWQHNIY